VKSRLASALALGAAAMALPPSAAAAAADASAHIGGAELVASQRAPAAPDPEPPFARPRVAYRALYEAAIRAGVEPGRDILRAGLVGGGLPSTSEVRRSNMVMWEALHPEPEPTFPSPGLRAIAMCESGGDPTAVSAGGTYRGMYQFDMRTWRSVGGRGDPAAASAEEQGRRAAILYARRGPAPWPICGY
jgi:hypothetical protein